MKNNTNPNKRSKAKTIFLIIFIILTVLLFVISFVEFCLIAFASSDLYHDSDNDCIYYNGEIYYEICEENKDLFEPEFYSKFPNGVTSIGKDDLYEYETIYNQYQMFLSEPCKIFYTSAEHTEVEYIDVDLFLTSAYFAKPHVEKTAAEIKNTREIQGDEQSEDVSSISDD